MQKLEAIPVVKHKEEPEHSQSRSILGSKRSKRSAKMPPNQTVTELPFHPSPSTKQSPRPATNDAKAKRIVKLVLETASLCGWSVDVDTRQMIREEMFDFERRTYEMDTKLEHAQTHLERKDLLDGHRQWVASRIKNFPRKLVIESLFYFGEEAKFKQNPQHIISLENIERICVARSNDIRALFELLKNDTGFEIPEELVVYTDCLLMLFDLNEDLLDYADDVTHQTYNTWCAMQRLHGKDSKETATDLLNSKLNQLFKAEYTARSLNVVASEAIDRLQNVLLEDCPVRQVGLRGLELFSSKSFLERCVDQRAE